MFAGRTGSEQDQSSKLVNKQKRGCVRCAVWCEFALAEHRLGCCVDSVLNAVRACLLLTQERIAVTVP